MLPLRLAPLAVAVQHCGGSHCEKQQVVFSPTPLPRTRLCPPAVLPGREATERRCVVLRRLLTRCNPEMAFYLVQIILKGG